MASFSEILVENSIQAALASIEIYNKPDFKYREQTFSILNVNAWELLLKAKIVKDAGEDISSLYVQRSDGEYKTNRSGNFLTIEVIGALSKLALDIPVAENIKALRKNHIIIRLRPSLRRVESSGAQLPRARLPARRLPALRSAEYPPDR